MSLKVLSIVAKWYLLSTITRLQTRAARRFAMNLVTRPTHVTQCTTISHVTTSVLQIIPDWKKTVVRSAGRNGATRRSQLVDTLAVSIAAVDLHVGPKLARDIVSTLLDSDFDIQSFREAISSVSDCSAILDDICAAAIECHGVVSM